MSFDEDGKRKDPTLRERLDAFMEEAARRVAEWPDWKRNVGLMDVDRQYNRYEPGQTAHESKGGEKE